MVPLDTLTIESFSPHLGETFHVFVGEPSPFKLQLIDAAELGGTMAAAAERRQQRAPFSLIFRGPKEPALRQMTHTLDHPTMGEMSIFLVPIGPDEEGMQYQAIFA
jgi:hypothetical protein